MKALLASILFLTVAAATVAAYAYRGDGTFVDRGPIEAHNRYILDLGPVDFARNERRTFRLGSLPSTEFTIGFEISPLDNASIAIEDLTTQVHLRLENERNEVVFDLRAPASTWVLSSSSLSNKRKGFLYLRGVETQVPLADGKVRLERRSVRSDGGWGTYFTPRSNASYQLLFESEAVNPVSLSVRLVALGAGWK